MAAKSPVQKTDIEIDAETAAGIAAHVERLMDEVCPGHRERAMATSPKGRTIEESIKILQDRELRFGPSPGYDEDFARDVEEGRRALRSDTREWE